MKRISAFVIAIGLVVTALVVRSNMDDTSSSTSGRKAAVVCVPELEAACRTLGNDVDLTIEVASATAKRIIDGASGIDAWITLDGWPELVDARLGRTATKDVIPLAFTKLVIAGVKERTARLATGCGDPGWSCWLNSHGKSWAQVGGDPAWGTVKVALPPSTSALGLLLEANALSSLAGTVDLATNDDGYPGWLAAVRQTIDDADPLGAFLLAFPAQYSAVGTTEAQTLTRLGSRQGDVSVLTPAPTAYAVAVIASFPAGKDVDAGKLTAALVSQRWATLPEPDPGLPAPGVLLALSGL